MLNTLWNQANGMPGLRQLAISSILALASLPPPPIGHLYFATNFDPLVSFLKMAKVVEATKAAELDGQWTKAEFQTLKQALRELSVTLNIVLVAILMPF